jgi:ribonuclease HI
MIDIYTDGACSGNPGPGGWGAILRKDATEKELFGGEALTTNNRMEMMAVIEALRALKQLRSRRACIPIRSTCRRASASGSTAGSGAAGRPPNKEPVKNEDLWRELDRLAAQHRIEWIWVKGHAGHVENERADDWRGAASNSPARRLSAQDHPGYRNHRARFPHR